MLYQIVKHYDASQNSEKSPLVAGLKRVPWKDMIMLNDAITPRKWLVGILQITLVSALAVSGCDSKDSGEQSKQMQQQTGGVVTKPAKKEVGEASWYGPGFQGKETANGETYDQNEMTAAHPNLPMGTKAKVTNLENGKKVDVRINDRGPYADGRVIDLSGAAAKKIDMKGNGTAQVKIETKPTKNKVSIDPSSKAK
jgi:rare lipoprotein A (peptidoglycan hydrolase)